MNSINPRPPRTLEIEKSLKGKSLAEKVEYFILNAFELSQYQSCFFGLTGEDFYAATWATYKMNKRYKNELEFALDQRARLLQSMQKVENNTNDTHQKPYLPIWQFNVEYFNKKLLELYQKIEAKNDITEYSEFILYQLKEIVDPENIDLKISANKIKLNWKGNNNVLIDIFYQLKRIPTKSKDCLITNSNEELAQFLKESFDCFEDTKLSTITGQLKSSTRPKVNRIDIDQIIKDE